MTRESILQQQIRLALGQESDVVLFRNNVGQATYWDDRAGRVMHVRYGLAPGSADLIGIGPGGRFVSLELKGRRGLASADQERWLQLVERRGGAAAIVRSVEEALAFIERIRREHSDR